MVSGSQMLGVVVSLLAVSTALAQSRSVPQQPASGALVLEAQPPALDGSYGGFRLLISPSPELPWAVGLMARAGGWNSALGAKLRFEGAEGAEVRLTRAIGLEGRYRLATLGGGLRPFLGLTVGFEEFALRPAAGSASSDESDAFVEPALGLAWQPSGGRLGLVARAGPGFNFKDQRLSAVGGAQLRLRPVYPAASLGAFVAF
ncbi:MAG TPA: hypothetical protein VFO83_09180 [Aggregicoccus sp.]|nr:hypothetical protein [Aggregicoccus sp.]